MGPTLLILGSAVAVGLVSALVWWGTRWIPKRWARVYWRVVLIPTFFLVFRAPVLSLVTGSWDRGGWRCIVSGATENRTTYMGIRLRGGPREPEASFDDTGAFERWYWREIGRPHEHDWVRVGCHQVGILTIACYEDPGASYYLALPRLPDPLVAQHMAQRVIDSPFPARRVLVFGVCRGSEEPNPFVAISEGAVMSKDEFAAGFATWLDWHPEWR